MVIHNDKELGVEIKLKNEDSFLLIKETLTRMGIASFKNKVLWQSCHILHKRGKYYIIHFKELFLLDGKESNMTMEDSTRRFAIAKMLEDWGMCEIISEVPELGRYPKINVIRHSEKNDWELCSKYTIGNI